jgi:DNA-binding response OmpR family regulator
VALHYGHITVNSQKGTGTEFTVTLPLGKNHLKEEEFVSDVGCPIPDAGYSGLSGIGDQESGIKQPKAINYQPATDHGQLTTDNEIILIVEDNKDFQAFIRQHLEPTYKVIEAVDGQDGFEKATAAIPDLIISDIMMPKMDGYQLCHALKNDQRTSHIPVILLTARAGEDSKLAGLETGADDYLTKPFSSRELLVRAKNLIEQRRKLREKFSRDVVLKPSEIAITSMDEQFLNRVKEVVEKYISDEDFTVEDLGHKVGMSRVQLHRKLRALTNQSASQFILSMRLQRAIDLIKQNAGTVSEIAYMVGFNTPNYFAKCFRKRFGCSPSEYGV